MADPILSLKERLSGRSIYLIGMMGSGKTSTGRPLAKRLGYGFVDADAVIEQVANCTIPEIFERDGEPFFRSVESKVLERLLQGPPCVLSTGGGAFMFGNNRALISKLGISVFLSADLELLWERVRSKDTRPLLKTADPKATLARIFEARRDQYLLADVTVQSHPNYSIAQTTEQVIAALRAQPGVFSPSGEKS